MSKPRFDTTAESLTAQGIPAVKAMEKSASLRQGKFVIGIGIVILGIASVVGVGPMIWLHEAPGIPLLLFAALIGVAGLFVVVLGGFIASAEAAEHAGGFFGLLATAAKKVRG